MFECWWHHKKKETNHLKFRWLVFIWQQHCCCIDDCFFHADGWRVPQHDARCVVQKNRGKCMQGSPCMHVFVERGAYGTVACEELLDHAFNLLSESHLIEIHSEDVLTAV